MPFNGIFVDAPNITIQNNIIRDQRSVCGCDGERWYGIYLHAGNNLLVEGNDIYNNPGGGIQIYTGPSNGVTIRNNKIHDNNTLPVSVIGGILVQSPGLGELNVKIYNNLIYNNGSNPSHNRTHAFGIQIGSGVVGAQIFSNTIFGNDGYGIQIVDATDTGTIVKNNIVYGNSLADIKNNGSGTTLISNLTVNPLFVNAGALDFHLQAGSAAINQGVTLGSPWNVDYAGTARPQGGAYDMGAYEFTGTATPPAAPSGVHMDY